MKIICPNEYVLFEFMKINIISSIPLGIKMPKKFGKISEKNYFSSQSFGKFGKIREYIVYCIKLCE